MADCIDALALQRIDVAAGAQPRSSTRYHMPRIVRPEAYQIAAVDGSRLTDHGRRFAVTVLFPVSVETAEHHNTTTKIR
jgi:hypothetical protein